MADLTLNISQYSPLQQFTVRPWETFSPDDQLAITDKINLIVQTLNRLGKLSNDVVTDWNKVMTWVSNDGMTAEVDSQLQKWKDDGTLTALINAYTNIGDLTTLQTVAKDTIVNAINENVVHLAERAYSVKSYGGAKGDGITDDTVALQNTFNVSAGLAVCLIPKGTYLISAQLNIPSNCHIQLEGTILLAPNMALTNNGGVLNMIATAARATNILIEGSGFVDGNYANQTTQQTNLDYGTNGFKSLAGSFITIKGVTFRNIPNTPLLFSSDTLGNGSTYCLVDGVTIANSGKSSRFEYYTSHDCKIVNSTIYGTFNDSNFTIYNGASRCTIDNCTIYGSGFADGITVYNAQYTSQGAVNDCIITNNVIYNNYANGISVGSGQAPAVKNNNIVISNNRVFGNNTGNGLNLGGIRCYQGTNLTIIGNQVSKNGNGTNGSVGITCTCNKSVVNSNTIWDEGQGSTTGIGLMVNSDVIIKGNSIFDDQGTPTMQYAVYVNAGSPQNILCQGNTFGTTWATSGKAIYQDNNMRLAVNNLGYNPIGLLATQPTLPVSGTSTNNFNPYPVRITVSGGTVTNILINGTGTNLTSGVFTLGYGESINIQYTASPIWKWFGS